MAIGVEVGVEVIATKACDMGMPTGSAFVVRKISFCKFCKTNE